jgi:hypothetical protein
VAPSGVQRCLPACLDCPFRSSANCSAINGDCTFSTLNHIACMKTAARRRVQSRETSLLEAATNVTLGFVLALVMQALLYPLEQELPAAERLR